MKTFLCILTFLTIGLSEDLGYYEKLTDEKIVTIPFSYHNGKPLLDLEIDGKPAKLMIDNGRLWDEVWFFGSDLVDDLNFQSIEDSEISGAGEGDPTASFTSRNISMKFKEVEFFEQPTIVSPKEAGFASMFPGVDGQLCNTFFKNFVVEFDFEKNLIFLHDINDFTQPKNSSVFDMSIKDDGSYSIPASIKIDENNNFTGAVDIDFGGIYDLKIALNNDMSIPKPENFEITYSAGAQGSTKEFKSKVLMFELGDAKFNDLEVVYGDGKFSRINENSLGVIGLPLFQRFKTIFDFSRMKLYLEKRK
ncbi:MAG: hypothetical protein JXR48_02035 [Candidatus Delongbacteria bacterium]|nr:hypothetical protein [Candidatus Delongbacteria bacterium]MBN2833725.1 hypothetical protein [Candidatus Delongbacteria bacterium]